MRIKFFLTDNEMAPTTISGKMFAFSLIKLGYDVEVVNNYSRKKEIIDTREAEIIIFQKKLFRGHTYDDIKDLKGKVFLCHIDDDFEGMNEEKYRKTLENTDLVLVGNNYHVEKLKKYIQTPVEAITSISDFENYPYKSIDEKNNNPLIIAWQQNLADVYIEDLKTVVKPLTEIYKKYEVELRLYGWHEGKHYGVPDNRKIIKELLPFAKCISFQPLEEYLKNIVPQVSNSDIGIIPYVDIEARYGKSSYSLRKMMMMGVPMVVSNFGNNKEMLKDGINGFLASNEEEWYVKIEKLILDRYLRGEFSVASRKFLEEKFNYENTVDIFINAINKHYGLKKKNII